MKTFAKIVLTLCGLFTGFLSIGFVHRNNCHNRNLKVELPEDNPNWDSKKYKNEYMRLKWEPTTVEDL